MVSPLDDLFIFKSTSFQPSGTSSFASVSQSALSHQSSGSEPCSGLQYRALNWHWFRERTAKEWGPKALSSVVDDSQPQPHGIFFLCFGSRERGLVFPIFLQVASNMETILVMSHGRPDSLMHSFRTPWTEVQ